MTTISTSTVTIWLWVGEHLRFVRARVYQPGPRRSLVVDHLEVEGPRGWQPLKRVSERHYAEIYDTVNEAWRRDGTDQDCERDWRAS